MSLVEVNGKNYHPEDLDCNGTPYKNAIPVTVIRVKWETLHSGQESFELKTVLILDKPRSKSHEVKIDVKKNYKSSVGV
jgi:hypothetical protein